MDITKIRTTVEAHFESLVDLISDGYNESIDYGQMKSLVETIEILHRIENNKNNDQVAIHLLADLLKNTQVSSASVAESEPEVESEPENKPQFVFKNGMPASASEYEPRIAKGTNKYQQSVQTKDTMLQPNNVINITKDVWGDAPPEVPSQPQMQIPQPVQRQQQMPTRQDYQQPYSVPNHRPLTKERLDDYANRTNPNSVPSLASDNVPQESVNLMPQETIQDPSAYYRQQMTYQYPQGQPMEQYQQQPIEQHSQQSYQVEQYPQRPPQPEPNQYWQQQNPNLSIAPIDEANVPVHEVQSMTQPMMINSFQGLPHQAHVQRVIIRGSTMMSPLEQMMSDILSAAGVPPAQF